MRTDYIQGIIINSGTQTQSYSNLLKASKSRRTNHMRGVLLKFASDLGINSKQLPSAVYARPRKLSARKQHKRQAEMADLISRIRIRSY